MRPRSETIPAKCAWCGLQRDHSPSSTCTGLELDAGQTHLEWEVVTSKLDDARWFFETVTPDPGEVIMCSGNVVRGVVVREGGARS